MSTGFFIVPSGTDLFGMAAADLKASLYPVAASPVCGLDPRPYDVYPVGTPVGVNLLPLDGIAALVAAAYSPARRIRTDYSGPILQVRRSSDNAALNIGAATAVQTRTNIAAVPANNGGGFSAAGITMTTLGTGTEFGLPYVEVRYAGTATANGTLFYAHSAGGVVNPTIHAVVTPGVTYTLSLGYRLVAGTAPAGVPEVRATWRNSTGAFISFSGSTAPIASAQLARIAVVAAAPANAAYVQPSMALLVVIGDTVDFTVRFYSPNVEQGVGNARPLLQRNVTEVVAGIGDLDVDALLAHVGSGSGFVTRLYDQGLNARDFVQSTPGAQPIIVRSGAVVADNTHPSMTFDGSATVMGATIPLVVETTALLVATNTPQAAGGSTHKALLAGNGTSFAAAGTQYGLSYSADATQFGVSLGNGTTEQRVAGANTVDGALQILGFDRAGNTTTVRRNGASIASGTQDRTTGFTNGYNLGADPSTTRYYTGRISEVYLVNNTLSTAQRQRLERGLGIYYGITVS